MTGRRWHPELTPEKLATFPLQSRLDMIRNEISRARSSQAAGYYGSTRLALERCLELVDITVETTIRSPVLRDLLRWRERIAKAYLFPEDPVTEELLQGPAGVQPEALPPDQQGP